MIIKDVVNNDPAASKSQINLVICIYKKLAVWRAQKMMDNIMVRVVIEISE